MNEDIKMIRQQNEERLRELFSNKEKNTLYELLDDDVDQAKQNFREIYRRQSLFMHCFTDYYLETIDDVSNCIFPKISKPGISSYGYFVSFHIDQFKSMRSALILVESGYPFQGYSLLRNVYEESIFMSAILQKITTISEMQGILESEAYDAIKIKKRRRIWG